MKKYALPAAVLLLCGMFTACSSKTSLDSNGQSSPLIGDEVTKVNITHVLAGQSTEWSVEGDDIEALRRWANGLAYERCDFDEGDTPGDAEGQEAYWFELTGGERPGFDYVICGPDDCYLLIEDDWYAVKNPSDPMDEADFSDEALKNWLIYGAFHDSNADNHKNAVTGVGLPLDDEKTAMIPARMYYLEAACGSTGA